MSNGLSNAATFPQKEKIIMKAIVVTDQAAGTARDEAGGAARAAGSDK
jgi:hypothetical protein